jgi:hypothetical protein
LQICPLLLGRGDRCRISGHPHCARDEDTETRLWSGRIENNAAHPGPCQTGEEEKVHKDL